MMTSSNRARTWLKEVSFVILIAATVFFITSSTYERERELGQKPNFYQAYYEPAVRMACGQPFGVDPSGKISEEMKRFLEVEQQTLSCDSVTPATALETNPPTRTWYHLFVATALIWKVTGISWFAMDGFAAALLAIAAVMVYSLSRLLMPRPISAALAVVSSLPALRFLLYLRDVNKAPFILAAVFVAVWLIVRTPTRRHLLGAMAALGLWIGIGYGFRPDVLVVLPLVIVTVLFFRPVPLRRGWFDGVLASALLFGTFLLAASPVLSAFSANVGTCTWHFGLLGLSETHTAFLGVTPADYSWLTHYDDSLAWRSVESYGKRVLSMPSIPFATPTYDQASKVLYLDTFKTFPGDFMTRGAAAGQTVIGYGICGIRWIEAYPSWEAFFASHRASIQSALVAGWIAIVLAALACSIRVGVFSIFALAYLACYPAIQFDQRHYFHLAFLSWLPPGIALGWLTRASISMLRQRSIVAGLAVFRMPGMLAWIRAVAILIGVFGMAYAMLWGARYYQASAVERLFEHYVRATGDEAIVTAGNVPGENMTLAIDPPEPSGQSEFKGRMLRLDIDAPNSTSSEQKVCVEFGHIDPDYVFKKELPLEFGPARRHATVFIPSYLQRLSLVLPPQSTGLTVNATWLRSDELPSLWVLATLYPDWHESRLYQTY